MLLLKLFIDKDVALTNEVVVLPLVNSLQPVQLHTKPGCMSSGREVSLVEVFVVGARAEIVILNEADNLYVLYIYYVLLIHQICMFF